MLRLAAVAALVLVSASTASPASRRDFEACAFRDVVRAPDSSPAVLDQTTWRFPDLQTLLLPSHPTTIAAWMRISAAGHVTDVCVPGAAGGLRERIVEAARALRYVPARHGSRPTATVAAVRYEIPARYAGRPLHARIQTATGSATLTIARHCTLPRMPTAMTRTVSRFCSGRFSPRLA
jgi:hypothetical protein